MQDIFEYANYIRREVETTLRVFYALRQFRWSLTQPERVHAINLNVHFWTIFESSARTNMFVGIRRLFESKSDTHDFQSFINHCRGNIEGFSAPAIRERKLKGSSNAEDWIDEYMQRIYVGTRKDILDIGRMVRDSSRKMRSTYTEAATKIYVHAIHTDPTEMFELSKDFEFREIETALTSVWHAYQQIWQLYLNGRKPTLKIEAYPYADEIAAAVDSQILGSSA